MKYLIPLTLLLLLFSCEDNVTEVEEFDLLFISSEGNFGAGDGSIEVFKGLEKIQTVENVGDVVQVTGIGTETDTYSKITEVNTTTKISIAKTSSAPLPKSGQFLIHLGSPVVISGTPSFNATTKVTTFTTSSAHGLVKGNSFRVLDSSNNNIGDFVVKDRNSVT